MHKHFKSQSRLWDYNIIKKLGRGTSGQVYQVQNKSTQQTYALKKIPLIGTQDRQKLNAFKQIKCLSLLNHPSIISYHESFLSMDHIYIIMQYANKGDFMKIIQQRKRKEKYFTQNELWALFTQIVNAVKYLHQKNVIHRDIKLQNIFMAADEKIKLGDLGMSKIMHKPDQLISTRVGTPIYFAPEMIQNQLYSFPVDVWALGCVLYYLAALQHPFQQATMQTLGYYVIDRPLKPINGRYSVQMINFINSCFEKQVSKRSNIFELALKIKSINQQSSSPNHRYNRISIFNMKQLNKIFATTQNNAEKTKRKQQQQSHGIRTQRKLSSPQFLKSGRRTSYSMRNPLSNNRRPIKSSQQSRYNKLSHNQAAINNNRQIKSSLQKRRRHHQQIMDNNFIDFEKVPQTNPIIKKKHSYQQSQQNIKSKTNNNLNKYESEKFKKLLVQNNPQQHNHNNLYGSLFMIKTNGFTNNDCKNKTQNYKHSNDLSYNVDSFKTSPRYKHPSSLTARFKLQRSFN